jgi:hypothetical protein
MEKLRGTGNTFSTSGKTWLPFHYNPERASKMARLHRLQRKGLTPPTDKASLREAARQAVAEWDPMKTGTAKFKRAAGLKRGVSR